MKWLGKLKVGSKLILGFSIMILIVAAIGYVGYFSVERIERSLEEVVGVRLPAIDFLIEADRDLQQLLVAERSMIFTDAKSDVFKEFMEEYEKNLKQAEERWEGFKALANTPQERAIFPQFEKAQAEWMTISRRVVDGRLADTRQGRRDALDLTLGPAKQAFEKMRDNLDQLTEINLNYAKESRTNAAAVYRITLITMAAITGGGLLVGLLLMWGIGQGVSRPLKRVIDGLSDASDQVTSASTEVSSTSQQLAEGSSEQAASIEETSSSLEEMSSMTRRNAENAGQADSLMKEASQVVASANSMMKDLRAAMDRISNASDETAKIIKTIDEIAFQTNLLALNAAVEAARAGEAGAGFAVVADEVRNLAMRAAEAAKSTAGLIEGNISNIKNGSEMVVTTDEAFDQVAESVKKVGELLNEIASASSDQAQGVDQINRAIGEMDKVTQQNSASAEESAAAAEELSAQAETMKGMVGELVVMVESSKSRTPTKPRRTKGAKKAITAGLAPKPAKPAQDKDANAQNLIPFDDDTDDFNDF